MDFKDFQKELDGIGYRSEKDWEILLPTNTPPPIVQTIISKCRKLMLINWHIVFPKKEDGEMNYPDTKDVWVSIG